MQVVHEFTSPSRVLIGCSDHEFDESMWSDLKITAIGVSSLENAPLLLIEN